ncbi:MAG: Ser-Thr-rich GPI-anchored membrane family protein [Ignavibacteriaceae bacterium]
MNELIVAVPNGGESWQRGTTHTINWSDNISENVKIELFKGGVFNSVISLSAVSNGSFSWNIPVSTNPGSDYTVKITSVNNPSINDVSDANFEIFAGAITVVSPNGGESWAAGSTQVISWNNNISENVKIDLYKNGIFNSNITSSTSSDGTYNWDIPFTLQSASDYTIKITSVSDTSITDVSDANFTIIGNQIAVTSPNGGENWLESEDQLITWTDNLAENVQIQLFKGGIFHSSITTSTPSSGSFVWNPPSSIPSGSDYTIKISSVIDGAIFDFSDNTFTIINNNITVLTPNGGENWLIGSSHTITWTDDISGEVKIELLKSDTLYSKIAISVPSSGSYNWNFAGAAPGQDYKIKITSIDQPALFDLSDNDFSLFSGDITVVTPNGSESWLANSSQTIFWSDNIDGDVTIDLYKSDTLHSIISGPTSSDGARDWTLPFDIESGDDYKVKITSVDNPAIFDFSDANFTIEGFEITITSPNGGEVWYVGQDYNITWTDNLTGSIEIHLLKNGVFDSVIDPSDPSDGIKTWSIPAGQETGSDYSIRIASTDNSNIVDTSDARFTLAQFIVMESPNGGESWQSGSTQTITWNDNLVGNVKLELYRNGVKHSDIITSAPSDGAYTWVIPASTIADTTYKVKIISAEDTTVFDYSNNNFEIFSGSITVDSPNGGEIWQAGTTYSITWSSDITENVKLELYKGGSLHTTIDPSTNNDGQFNWDNMPFTIESGSDYQIKITSTSNPATFDFSDGNFTINGNEITVTSPNGGETWLIGEPYFITWNDNLVGNVEILLYQNNNVKLVIDSNDPSDGSYTWTIPGSLQPGSNYKIKISSVNDANIFDFSDAEFTITNVLAVENISNEIPDIYTLYQNYPNPFNPQTKIEFGLPEESTVTLKIYDLTGQEVDVVLNNENLYAGKFRFDFDATYLPSGVYFYILTAKSTTSDLSIRETKKMILMK